MAGTPSPASPAGEHEITIDPATGFVTVVGTAATIRPGEGREAVAAALAPFLRTTQDHRNGHEWLRFRGLAFGGRPAALSVCFHHGKARELAWSVDLRDDPGEASWPSPGEIEAEVAFVLAVLRERLARPFRNGEERFAWGVAWSMYDRRGDTAGSGLRYGP